MRIECADNFLWGGVTEANQFEVEYICVDVYQRIQKI